MSNDITCETKAAMTYVIWCNWHSDEKMLAQIQTQNLQCDQTETGADTPSHSLAVARLETVERCSWLLDY